ncbi:MAG: hypothetical protein ACREML_00060, partial [Vulcanimicrobiaceae bacterium]
MPTICLRIPQYDVLAGEFERCLSGFILRLPGYGFKGPVCVCLGRFRQIGKPHNVDHMGSQRTNDTYS